MLTVWRDVELGDFIAAYSWRYFQVGHKDNRFGSIQARFYVLVHPVISS